MKLAALMRPLCPTNRAELTEITQTRREGDAWLAGGTGLFTQQPPGISRLVDLLGLDWQPLSADTAGLTIAATCDLGTLDAFEAPRAWRAASFLKICCHAFPAKFKNWTRSTVGGNLCTALPSGPMITLCAALEGICLVWTPSGGERRVSVADLVRGPGRPALRPGEVLRSIHLPAEALERPLSYRRLACVPGGGSDAFLVGTVSRTGNFVMTVTGTTRRPLQFDFAGIPDLISLKRALAADIPDELFHASTDEERDWCRCTTLALAGEICADLLTQTASFQPLANVG